MKTTIEWIPVYERLPENGEGPVLITKQQRKGCRKTIELSEYYFDQKTGVGFWSDCGQCGGLLHPAKSYHVIAWAKLPKAYEERRPKDGR